MARVQDTRITVWGPDGLKDTLVPAEAMVRVVARTAGAGFVEVEIRPDRRVVVRGWRQLEVTPKAANLIEVREEPP